MSKPSMKTADDAAVLPSPFLIPSLLLAAAALGAAFWVRVIDADLFWHLRTGAMIAETGRVPRFDPFTFTVRGREWIAQEWLWDLAAFRLFDAAGFTGLNAARVAGYALALGLAGLVARRRGASWFSAACAAVCALAPLAASPGVRPQDTTMAFFAAAMLTLHAARREPRWLFALAPLTLLWANLHGAFLILAPLAGCAVAGWWLESRIGARRDRTVVRDFPDIHRSVSGMAFPGNADLPIGASPDATAPTAPIRRLAFPGRRSEPTGSPNHINDNHTIPSAPFPWRVVGLAAGAVVLAALANPVGWKLVTYPLRVLAVPELRRGIAEWAPPGWGAPFQPFHAFVAITIAAAVAARRRLGPGDWLTLAVFGVSAYAARRQAAFFAVAALPVMALGVEEFRAAAVRRWLGRRSAWAADATALAAGAAMFAFGLQRLSGGYRGDPGAGPQPGRFPERAAAILRVMNTGGNLLNDYNDGGYLINELHPRWSVFIDGRSDLYGGPVLADYKALFAGPMAGVGPLLEKWRVDAIVVRHDAATETAAVRSPKRNLARALADDPRWAMIWFDDRHALFLREGAMTRATDHKPYRRLHPALPWAELAARQTTAADWSALGADLRRARDEDPTSRRVADLAKMFSAATPPKP